MQEIMLGSKEIVEKAIKDYKPEVIVLMLSGGDDSMTAYHVAMELGIRIDFVIHGNTRTGIPQTTKFACKQAELNGHKLLLADAGDSYVNYVMRKGFFGKGENAHAYSYHILKQQHFEKVVSKYIRQRRRNYKIMFLNGARRLESENRKITMKNPIKITRRKKNDIWVNIINEWTKHNCTDYLEGNGITRNPVSINLCRSGECMCGTMQTEGDRNEAAFYYPEWGKWLDDLESSVTKKFPWGWNDSYSQSLKMELMGQQNIFQPMCTGCKINFLEKEKNHV